MPAADRAVVMDELEELFGIRFETRGRSSARRWYLRQVAGFAWTALRRPGEAEVMGTTAQQIRQSVRGLLKAPAFTATAILTLALGIGAPVAIFSVVNGVLLQAMPYPDADRLVWIFTDSPPNQWPFSVADYQALEERSTTLESFGAWSPQRLTFNDEAGADRILAYAVTPTFFRTLGVAPALGRDLTPEDGEPEADRVVLVSHDFWQTRLGGDPDVLGRSLRLEGQRFEVVGVMPPHVGPVEGTDAALWPAMRLQPPPRKGPFFLNVVGRLKSDVSLGAATEELRAINDEIFPIWADSYSDRRTTWGAVPASELVVGNVRTALWVLLGGSALVLLIAATNVTNLVVSRATSRARELAVRSALGASRVRLLGVQMSETLLVALGGGLAGLALAHVGVDALTGLAPGSVPRASEIGLHPPVLLFAAVLTVGTGVLAGLAPGLGVGRDTAHALHGGARSGGSRKASRMRGVLVAAQFAVALPLLVGAGLLITSFNRLISVDPGFDPDRVMSFHISLPSARYEALAETNQFWDRLRGDLVALPGVEAVGYNASRPPNRVDSYNNFALEIRRTPEGSSDPGAPWTAADRGFFEALQIPLIAGRFFSEGLESSNELVVDQQWVRQHVPEGVNPLGLRLVGGSCTAQAEPVPPCAWQTVVGVVGAVKYMGLDVEDGAVYQAQPSSGYRSLYVYLGGPEADLGLLPQVREIVRRHDPELAVAVPVSGDQFFTAAIARPRYLMTLFGLFALVALALATIGIYGVMSYFVSQRTRDIGIRVALGGRHHEVMRMVVSQGLRLAVLGTLAGVVAALVLSRFLAGLLFGVGATDPTTFALIGAGLGATALVACWIPARRATRVDPMVALRIE